MRRLILLIAVAARRLAASRMHDCHTPPARLTFIRQRPLSYE
jgi:hypothetical protein